MKISKYVATALLVVFAAFLINNNLFSEDKTPSKESTVKIFTSAQCGTCKKAIEKAVKKLDGIESADLDVKTKFLTVAFIPDKTNPDEIRKAVNKAGYDADSTKADERAYNKLPKCCKKDGGH
jgi:periplasmic mercuric ion binding protein